VTEKPKAQPEVEAKVEPVKVEDAPTLKVEEPKAVEETVVEAPATEVVQAAAPEAKPEPVTEPATKATFKGHATAAMAKAPGSDELKEITVVAAPLRETRFQGKGAGSQVASNSAGAGMTKPQY
jgi:ribonuclease E